MHNLASKQFGSFTVELYPDDSPDCPLEWDDNIRLIEWGFRSELVNSSEHYNSEDAFLIALAQEIHPNFPDHIGSVQAEKIVKKHFVMSGDCNKQGRSHACIVGIKTDLEKEGIKNPQEFVDGVAENYNTWASGEVIGFITKENGIELDSCWGFYSEEEAYSHAKANFPTRDDQYYFDRYENQ